MKTHAMVVPCYNEETRFPYEHFLRFARLHPDVLICFVNDGSRDKTLEVLRGLEYECPDNVIVYSLSQNGGKSEAVRQGMLHVHSNYPIEQLGFLDADLATTPEEYLAMAVFKAEHAEFGAVVGSRIPRLGANIQRNDNRSLLSNIIKKFIRLILKAPFQDTQCGAKIFQRDIVPFLFREKFQTPWLFDVEIFLRLQEKFGRSTLARGVLEYPLMNWTEVGGSRLKLKHSVRIPLQLARLYVRYRVRGDKKKIVLHNVLPANLELAPHPFKNPNI